MPEATILLHDNGRYSYSDGYLDLQKVNAKDIREMQYRVLQKPTRDRIVGLIEKDSTGTEAQAALRRAFNGIII